MRTSVYVENAPSTIIIVKESRNDFSTLSISNDFLERNHAHPCGGCWRITVIMETLFDYVITIVIENVTDPLDVWLPIEHTENKTFFTKFLKIL